MSVIVFQPKILPRLIKAVLFTINNHKKYILEVGYQNKKIRTQYKWNHLNIMHIQSMVGNNNPLSLSHMAKSYIWLEGKMNVLMSF